MIFTPDASYILINYINFEICILNYLLYIYMIKVKQWIARITFWLSLRWITKIMPFSSLSEEVGSFHVSWAPYGVNTLVPFPILIPVRQNQIFVRITTEPVIFLSHDCVENTKMLLPRIDSVDVYMYLHEHDYKQE